MQLYTIQYSLGQSVKRKFATFLLINRLLSRNDAGYDFETLRLPLNIAMLIQYGPRLFQKFKSLRMCRLISLPSSHVRINCSIGSTNPMHLTFVPKTLSLGEVFDNYK